LATISQHWLELSYIKFREFNLEENPTWSTNGQWAFGQPSGMGGERNGNHDPTSGFTGDNVYGVNLSGDYDTFVGGPYYLLAGPLGCEGYNNIILRFARWLNTDTPEYVASKIEISNDGSMWDTVWQHTGDQPITDDSWQLMEYDISQYADNQQTVYIRWSYEILPSAYAYSGWNIDDIELWGVR
jgi:hypothetical protein